MTISSSFIYSIFAFIVGSIVSMAFTLYIVGHEVIVNPDKFPTYVNASAMTFITLIICWVQYLAYKNKKQMQVWEMNKDILLELIPLLHRAVDSSLDAIHNEHEEQQVVNMQAYDNEYEGDFVKVDWSFMDSLRATLCKLKSTYAPFLSSKFTASIDKYLEKAKLVDEGVSEGELDHLEAYEEELQSYKDLLTETYRLCGELSGMKVTVPSKIKK